jgi:hypothetical protein
MLHILLHTRVGYLLYVWFLLNHLGNLGDLGDWLWWLLRLSQESHKLLHLFGCDVVSDSRHMLRELHISNSLMQLVSQLGDLELLLDDAIASPLSEDLDLITGCPILKLLLS